MDWNMFPGVTRGVPGGCALFLKGLLFSGCGFFGGVTLTGAAAAAGYHFCTLALIAQVLRLKLRV